MPVFFWAGCPTWRRITYPDESGFLYGIIKNMARLELWYSAKPYIVTQNWGNFNPSYKANGINMDYHNGTDYLIGKDGKLCWPQRYRVIASGYDPKGAGYYVMGQSIDKWEIEGTECYDQVIFMHLAEPVKWKLGDIAEIGDIVGKPDNTGFSTGPHTHEGGYRVNEAGSRLDKNDANDSYDRSRYHNGFYAEDERQVTLIRKMLEILYKIAALLRV